jgi:hypothetical protein
MQYVGGELTTAACSWAELREANTVCRHVALGYSSVGFHSFNSLKKSCARFMLTPMFCVTPPNSRTVLSACLLTVLSFLGFDSRVAVASNVSDPSGQRQKFELAVKELRTGVGPRYEALRDELSNYALAIYLDALVIEGNLHYASSEEMNQFMAMADGSPARYSHAPKFCASQG